MSWVVYNIVFWSLVAVALAVVVWHGVLCFWLLREEGVAAKPQTATSRAADAVAVATLEDEGEAKQDAKGGLIFFLREED